MMVTRAFLGSERVPVMQMTVSASGLAFDFFVAGADELLAALFLAMAGNNNG